MCPVPSARRAWCLSPCGRQKSREGPPSCPDLSPLHPAHSVPSVGPPHGGWACALRSCRIDTPPSSRRDRPQTYLRDSSRRHRVLVALSLKLFPHLQGNWPQPGQAARRCLCRGAGDTARPAPHLPASPQSGRCSLHPDSSALSTPTSHPHPSTQSPSHLPPAK